MFTKKTVIFIVLNMLYILTCTGCLAEATEQATPRVSDSSSSQQQQDEHEDDDDDSYHYGANVPDSNSLSYSSSSSSDDDSTSEYNFYCVINSPYEVHRYELQCNEAEYLEVTVADCCISGDMWQAKTKVWDVKPNTAITITPNIANVKSSASRVYNNGGTENSPKKLTALVECSYKSGVNVFPAAALFSTKSDGYCTMKDLGTDIKM